MITREVAQYITMGSRLRELREHRGLTQKQLAERMKVSIAMVRRWESGGTKETAVRFRRWMAVAKMLQVSPSEIFFPVGSPVRAFRNHKQRLKRKGQIPRQEPIPFGEVQRMLRIGPHKLAQLIKRGDLKVALVQRIDARSLHKYIARLAGYEDY